MFKKRSFSLSAPGSKPRRPTLSAPMEEWRPGQKKSRGRRASSVSTTSPSPVLDHSNHSASKDPTPSSPASDADAASNGSKSPRPGSSPLPGAHANGASAKGGRRRRRKQDEGAPVEFTTSPMVRGAWATAGAIGWKRDTRRKASVSILNRKPKSASKSYDAGRQRRQSAVAMMKGRAVALAKSPKPSPNGPASPVKLDKVALPVFGMTVVKRDQLAAAQALNAGEKQLNGVPLPGVDDASEAETRSAAQRELARLKALTQYKNSTAPKGSRKSRVQRAARNKLLSSQREFVPRAIFAEKDAKSARAYATRLCAQSITSQAIHYVVSKHVGRFYVAATEAQRSAETRLATLYRRAQVRAGTVERMSKRLVSDVVCTVLSRHMDYVHKQRVAEKKSFSMQRLAMSRDISRLKSQLLMANSKQGRLVRSERLRLTRTASVAGGAAMLELTVDNIHELGDETKQKVGELSAATAQLLARLQGLAQPGHGLPATGTQPPTPTTGAAATASPVGGNEVGSTPQSATAAATTSGTSGAGASAGAGAGAGAGVGSGAGAGSGSSGGPGKPTAGASSAPRSSPGSNGQPGKGSTSARRAVANLRASLANPRRPSTLIAGMPVMRRASVLPGSPGGATEGKTEAELDEELEVATGGKVKEGVLLSIAELAAHVHALSTAVDAVEQRVLASRAPVKVRVLRKHDRRKCRPKARGQEASGESHGQVSPIGDGSATAEGGAAPEAASPSKRHRHKSRKHKGKASRHTTYIAIPPPPEEVSTGEATAY